MKQGLSIYFRLLFFINLKKSYLLTLSLLVLIGSIFEILSLGILYPTTEFFLSKDFTSEYKFLPDNLNYNILLPFTLLLLFCFKFLYMAFLANKKNQFVAKVNRECSSFMANRLLKFDYLDYLKINNSEKIRLIHRESMYLGDYTLNLINLISEILFSISLFIVLILSNLFFTIFFLFVALIIFILYKRIAKLTSNLGKGRVEQDIIINSSLYKLVNSYKLILLLEKANFFLKDFDKANYKKSILISKLQTVQNIQSYFIELIFIFLISCGLFISFEINLEPKVILPILVVFFASLLKLLPSLNKITQLWSTALVIKEHLITLMDYSTKYKLKSKIEYSENKFNNSIVFSNLCFNYGDKEIFKNLNFSIKKGQVFGIIGESGSGKSTILNLLLGLIKPYKGKILIDGLDHKKFNISSLIGFCDQKIFLTNDSIFNNITLGEKNFDRLHYESIVKKVRLEKFLENKGNYRINESIENISGGQLQRIGLARTLFLERDIIILDEFTSALDKENKTYILNEVLKTNKDKTFIIVTHDEEVLSKCDNFINLDNLPK